jgi:hypothetical protein
MTGLKERPGPPDREALAKVDADTAQFVQRRRILYPFGNRCRAAHNACQASTPTSG